MLYRKTDMSSLIKAIDFESNNESYIPLTLVSKSSLREWEKTASKFHQEWLKSQNFNCRKETPLVLPNEKGGISKILYGLRDKDIPNNPYFYSKLVNQLPIGKYEITNSLSEDLAFQVTLGWGLSHYQFDKYKKNSSLTLKTLKAPKGLEKSKSEAILKAIKITRDLINTPTNDLGPKELSDFSRTLAKENKASFREIVGEDLLKRGFPTIHAVGRASIKEPRLIDFTWGKTSDPKITLIGKGVCFDSGGLGIKSSGSMRWMKKDMGGAANVLGLASAIMDLKLPIRLRVIIPAVENSISSNSFRPGDIIKSRNGMNIEIGHTDAEGRLILCDALTLADEEDPSLLIDFATLTGAARVALGEELPAFFTNDEDIGIKLVEIGTKINDPLWRLPLWQPYNDDLQSSIADVNNVGERGMAGAIIAGLFLEKFVKKTTNWAHLDLFAWSNHEIPGRPKGGEAQTIRSILTYIENRYC
ncbi:MAG: leucyl aminopeptidase family protein [Sphingomonadales bacterium]